MPEAEKADNILAWLKINNENKRPSGWIIGAAVLLVLAVVAIIMIASFEIAHKNVFYPGSKIGRIDLSGLTKQEAEAKLQGVIDKISDTSITTKLRNSNQEKLVMVDLPLSADASRPIINVDLQKTININYGIGHSDNLAADLINQYLLAAGMRKMSAAVTIDRDYLKSILNEQLASEISRSGNARPDVKCADDKCEIFLINETDGLSYDFDKGINDWQKELGNLNSTIIILERKTIHPEVTRAEAEKLLPELERIFVASGTPIFKFEDKTWELDKSKLGSMIGFEKYNSQAIISIDKESFDKWFNDEIAEAVDVTAADATVEMSSGTISRLNAQRSGKKADIEKAYNDLVGFYRQRNYKDIVIDLKVDAVEPEVTMDNINDLGIKEIIGTGESNFAGSPANRIKNIKNGAAKLHGKIIKPGEEFSVMQNVLPVDAENGYFTELVIKGNKTTAEYGGGLCQIGTTMFRAALASGLPILERTNHSYNVTYYLENGLPGVDATIYDPKPDMKFKNDTGNYILIQARIAGTKLYFDFWGTKDGRTASRTKPKVWGWKNPAPTKIIETTDLKPGVKKCTETAHKGVSASFDYIVNYSDGHTATSTFTSVYRPWQEVCLIGVSSLSAASSTAPVE